MGCCLTTTATTTNHRPHAPKPQPPPPPFEEETVKEVLSETPIVLPKPQQPQTLLNQQDKHKPQPIQLQENVSEVSETCSYSESFSAATVAEDGEVTQKVKTKSPPAKRVAGKRVTGYSGELVRKERGSKPKPLSRKQMAPAPEMKRRTAMNAPRCRNVGLTNDGRRSRPPAVGRERRQRRDVLPVERGGKSTVKVAGDGGVSPEVELLVSESLENPLVSLECFIFL